MVIYGLTEREGDNYYISAPVVSAKGVVANYRKTHLWWKAEGLRHEPSFYKPGNKLVSFNLKGFKSGIMICYDGGFPEMGRSYANLGCSMVFWMNNRHSAGAKGELITEIWDKEGLIIGDAYPEEVVELRKENPKYTGLRPDLYYYG